MVSEIKLILSQNKITLNEEKMTILIVAGNHLSDTKITHVVAELQ